MKNRPPVVDECVDGVRVRAWRVFRWWERPRRLFAWLRGYDILPPTIASFDPEDGERCRGA